MKTFIVILKVIVIVILCADLFFWVAAHASGHKIPSKTDWSFALSALFFILVILLLSFWGRKIKSN